MSDFVTVLTEKWRVANTRHRCQECGRDIVPKESYYFESMVFEGRFHNHKTCRHCYHVRKYLLGMNATFMYGGLLEEVAEFDGWKPNLYVAGMGRKWKRKDGRMWRVIK